MNNITKWTLGGIGALVLAIGLAIYLWKRDSSKKPNAVTQGCTEVERNTYKLIAYSIESCPGDSGTLHYFGKVEQLGTPVERSLGFATRDLAFGWVQQTIDARQAGASRNTPPPPLLGNEPPPAGPQPMQRKTT
jgi:hypothetical protein